MPNKPKRPCAHPGCPNLSDGRFCDKHASRSRNDKDYDRYARDQTSRAFYTSAAWLRCREVALARDNHLCQPCLRIGKLEPATTVHHAKELRTNADKALDADNLISVCDACHNAVHKRRAQP